MTNTEIQAVIEKRIVRTLVLKVLENFMFNFGSDSDIIYKREDQPRDEKGRWVSDGGGVTSSIEKHKQIEKALFEIIAGADEAVVSNLRDDLEQFGGTNDVTLVKGDKKKGLIHIAERHGTETVPNILDALVDGKISKFVPNKKTVHIIKGNYEAVLSLDEHGKQKTWLLTGWNIK